MSETLPLLPLRNTVVFPHLAAPLAVGRPASMAAVEAVTADPDGPQLMVCVAQLDGDSEQPAPGEVHRIGTLVAVRRVEQADGGAQVLVQGLERVRLDAVRDTGTYLEADISRLGLPTGAGPELDALVRENHRLAHQIANLIDPRGGDAMFQQLVLSIRDPLAQHYRIATLANQTMARQQEVLEADDLQGVLELLHEILEHELRVNEVRREIADRSGQDIEKHQREALLRQQKQTIEEALGEADDGEDEVAELRERIDALDLPEAARREADRELKRLQRMNAQAPDYQMTRSYLELIAELPWTATTEDNLDLAHARQVLDEDHYGLEDVKERILEFLAVMRLNPKARAPILCFVGPPGVGKTSLGQSIARAIGRSFERIAVGGMHDEAELRGHRRTYIGAMPGRILQGVKRAEVANPVLMLDEIDKLGRDFRGDPSAALMEVLDPAQNDAFRDNYLNLPFDLSRVFFITTANSLESIPRPLLDRMEVIRLAGYSDAEKVAIARRYLLPRQREAAGLTEAQLTLDDEVIGAVIGRYTREAGVRDLERRLARIARKVARRMLEADPEAVAFDGRVSVDMLVDLLGPERFFQEQARAGMGPGVAAGLAWTEAGGDVLYVEAALVPKEDKVVLTGQLGEVMQESVRAARSWLWTSAKHLGIDRDAIEGAGIHVHVPAGAVPKDGPSAGVTMVTALASLYSGRPVRPGLAMTGEVTLSGLVLPVGGIKEKVLAAHRAGLRTVILPKDNGNDLTELPDSVRDEMTFVLADHIDTVLATALPDLGLPALQEAAGA
ncbi:MAG TPA: endopeptidase La [Pseudomonadales bacterium]|nr:endopeptidase La [Pseudomonadales bacterium]